MREVVTKGVAAIQLLLQDPLTSTNKLRLHLRIINSRYEELKSFDKRIHKGIVDVDDLEANLYELHVYNEKVLEIHMPVYFARPSTVPLLVAARSTGAPSHYSTVIRPRKTAAPSSDSKIVEADKMSNVPTTCKPLCFRLSERHRC